MASSGITFAVAEAICLLARAEDITVLAKRRGQRTQAEEERVHRGLTRSVGLELILFVPASTFVVLETIRYTLPTRWMDHPALSGALGVISFGFPWETFRIMFTRWALKSLKEFYDVLSEAEHAELSGPINQSAKTAQVGGEGA